MNQWHWIYVNKSELNTGKHLLTLWSNEQGSGIDKLLITSDPYFSPSGFGALNEFLSDFEDGVILPPSGYFLHILRAFVRIIP